MHNVKCFFGLCGMTVPFVSTKISEKRQIHPSSYPSFGNTNLLSVMSLFFKPKYY